MGVVQDVFLAPGLTAKINNPQTRKWNLVSSTQMKIIQVSQEECARLREGVPYVKVYRYNPKHLCPKLNG